MSTKTTSQPPNATPFGKVLALVMMLTLVTLLLWACTNPTETTATTASPPEATTPAEVTATTVTTTAVEPAAEASAAVTTTEAAATESTAAETTLSVQHFVIEQSQSEARFTLDEELLGSPKTVVGTTNLVSGEITVDASDFSKTTISPIQIDARGFATDSDRRDGAIQRFILGSNNDANRYIVFTPTAITGLPTTAAAGDTFTLQITGDLTISGVTKPVTFTTTVTVDSATQISGLATVQVLRSDYNLTIPSVPSVANVTDEVLLEFQFVAIGQ
ncbi:MAG: YceI family protein [Caldilineaceae bacterium]|nr:YceI family protein [Caldilineaceae bacterium]